VTDDRQLPIEPDPGPDADHEPRATPAEPAPGRRQAPPLPPPTPREPSSADVRPRRPDYRGEELDPERGPGLGCFWFQVIVLGFFIVIIPVGLNLNWPFELLALLLFVVIGLLLLTGQTVIFLLRLVAADRRSQGRRRPLASTTKTVGELEDELGPVDAAPAGEVEAAGDAAPAADAAPAGDVEAAGDAAPAADAAPAGDVEPASAPSGVVAAAGMFPASPAAADAPEGSPRPDELDGRAERAGGEGRIVVDEPDGSVTEHRTEAPEDLALDPGPESFRETELTPAAQEPGSPDTAPASHEPEPDEPRVPEPDEPRVPEPQPPQEPQEPDPGVRQ